MLRYLIILFLTFLFCLEVHAQYNLVPILQVEGAPGSGMHLGTGILGLGDINSDGKPDFAVGAHGVGKTFIYFGGKDVLDGITDITLAGGDNMVMGDLNGDGLKDLIIHQRRQAVENAIDSIFIYYGRIPDPVAIDTVPGLIISGGDGFTFFGNAMDIGDLNNDGFDDLVIGESLFNGSEGKIYIYMGKPQPSSVADVEVSGGGKRVYFGHRIRIGDLDGDSIPDLVISSDTRDSSNTNINLGTIDIYSGGENWNFQKHGFKQRLEAIQLGTTALHFFNLVDVNIDGRKDISCSGERLVSTLFFYGRPDSIRWTPDFIIPSPDTTFYRFFPYAVGVGDINNDSAEDFINISFVAGAPGAYLFVYLGFTNPVAKEVGLRGRTFVGSTAFWNVAGVGDVNGNGVNDFGATVPSDYSGSPDGYFVILSGNSTFTEVEEKGTNTPKDFTLSQNYPNPFNPQTTIEFTLAKREHVLLIVYDSLGKEIKTLLNAQRLAGTHKVIWDGTNNEGNKVASGSYYYRIIRDGSTPETKQLIFLK